jgi:glycosyltransferase involved in cell wall biosynthesis
VDLTIAVEHRFMRTPDGAVWTSTGLSRASWARYLGVFGRVRILARVAKVAAPSAGWARVDGDRVAIADLPHFVGPRAFLLHRRAVQRAIAESLATHPHDVAILRVPGTIGAAAGEALRAAARAFGVEVVGDPHDVFSPGAVEHPLRPLFRWWFARDLRALCRSAAASLYVTSAALQRRYPPPADRPCFAVSDVELGDEAFAPAPRGPSAPGGPPLRVIMVGTLEQLYKAPDLLIRGVARARARGLDVELVMVGDGRHRRQLEALAARLGLRDRARFAGHLASGAAVRRELDAAHVFALPSRAEGMPRALLEAMARGLPCIATPVGGIPELLPASDLVHPDPDAIAARLGAFAGSPALRADASAANLSRAHAFEERALQPLRETFYRRLAAVTDRVAGRRSTGTDA